MLPYGNNPNGMPPINVTPPGKDTPGGPTDKSGGTNGGGGETCSPNNQGQQVCAVPVGGSSLTWLSLSLSASFAAGFIFKRRAATAHRGAVPVQREKPNLAA